jgi:general secretion pathway protein C
MNRFNPSPSSFARARPEALLKVVQAALVLLLLVQAARIAVVLSGAAVAQPAPQAAPKATAPPPDLSVFERFDPFFRDQLDEQQVTAGDVTGVELFGVRFGRGRRGSAILGSNGVQAAYSVGEEVQPGVVLAEVGADHVVLARGGARTRIEFGALAPPLPPPAVASVNPASAPQGAPAAPPSPAASPAPASEAANP